MSLELETYKMKNKRIKENKKIDKQKRIKGPSVFSLIKLYIPLIVLLIILTIAGNSLNLFLPKIIAGAIDSYTSGKFILLDIVTKFSIITVIVLLLTYIQSIFQTYISEKVAYDLRKKLIDKISVSEFSYIQNITPSKILTNLTSDIDAIKVFVSQAVSSIISAVFLIFGAGIFLLLTNWKLALAVFCIIPIIAFIFSKIFGKIKKLFKKSQESIDWLNKVINESILGAALVRILNSQQPEYNKFLDANTEAKNIGMSILHLFASLIPVINFLTNMATLTIVSLGGYFVIFGHMTIGDFTAFNSYLSILIFPIIMIGFVSSGIAQADASYKRVYEILNSPDEKKNGNANFSFKKEIKVENLFLKLDNKEIIKNISFVIKKGQKNAIIGPTAAGKSQLFYLLTALIQPTSGSIKYDEKDISDYDKSSFHKQIGFVFQDSVIFNLSLRENIAFSNIASDIDLKKAIETADLSDFINSLPEKLDTVIFERGVNLSGGQKQRIMLARALVLNPSILFLDDFTARVDRETEKRILNNINKNYPGITLISITQKVAPVENYDQIILLMEGELLAKGNHKELLENSPEYMQIYNSQNSINNYELHA